MPKGRLRTEPGDVQLIVHDPIPAPALESADGARCAGARGRAHAVVAATVERLQEPTAPI